MHPDIMAALDVARTGALRGHTPGRHDNQNINVPGESFVVPADIISSLGDGNTEAGFHALEKLFPTLPHESAPKTGKVPIVAAAGEFIISPDHVKKIGGGDMKRGHRALEDFVKIIRKKTIKKLKSLPGPHK